MISASWAGAVDYTCPAFTHTDSAFVAPYNHSVVVTPANFSAGTGNFSGLQHRDFITLGNTYRFRQAGIAKKVRMYFDDQYGYGTAVYIKVWRKVGAIFQLISTSENILPQLWQITTGAIYDVTFAQPLTGIQEGDYYGYALEASAALIESDYGVPTAIYFLWATLPWTWEAGTRYVDQYINSPFHWETDPMVRTNSSAVPMEFTMTNPDVVFVGDGIVAGHPMNNSFLETTTLTNLPSTFSYAFGTLTSYITQNLGIGYLPQTTTDIAARFSADVLSQHPRVVVIEGGVNDIGVGWSLATYTGNITSMLAAAESDPAVQKVILLGILPWTNGSNGQHATVDTWNTELQNIAWNYSKAIYVDASVLVGQYRAGWSTGNRWDIIPAYTPDGVHYNATWASVISHVLQIALCSPVNPVWTYPANNDIIHTGTLVATGIAASGDLITMKNWGGAIIGTWIADLSWVWSILVAGMNIGASDAWAINQFTYEASDVYSPANPLSMFLMHTLIGRWMLVSSSTWTVSTWTTPHLWFAWGWGVSYAWPSTTPTSSSITTGATTGVIITPIVPHSTPIMYPLPPSSTTELEDVYIWGKMHAIISDATFEKTDFLRDLTRIELARLMVAYEKNIAGNTIVQDSTCDISTYSDYADISADMRQIVRDACSLGIMGWQNDKQQLLPAFRPNKIVTRAQLSAVLARYLYGDSLMGDMSKEWYTPYMTALHNDGIMNLIDQPDMIERRGYVVTMLQRLSLK
jgi:lysophospholipase L1-like esterase